MKKHRLPAAIGILVLLALVGIFIPRDGSQGRSEAADGVRERRPAGTESARARENGVEPDRQRQRPAMVEHRVEDLSRFILPLTEGHQVSLKGAVRILMEAYKDACYRSHTKPLALDFTLPDESASAMDFSIERGDFKAVLAHLAALAGYTVKLDGLRVTFEPVARGTETFAKTYQVKPGLQEALTRQLQRLGISRDPSLTGMAASAGLVDPGRSLTLGPSGQLQAELSAWEHRKLETWLASLAPATQIKASVALIHSKVALPVNPRQATAEEVRELIDSLGNLPGVRVDQTPTVTLREMQESTIEVIRGTPDDWTGSRIAIEAERGGLAFLARDSTEYRPEDHSGPAARATSHAVVRDGDPQLSLVGSRKGAYLYRLLTLELIDETGRPLRDRAWPAGGQVVATAVPGKPGMVFSPFNNKLVDVRDVPSGTLVADPTYPASEHKYFRVP